MSAQIYELIPQVMSDVGAIEKRSRNEQQKYFFRGIDDVLAAFQPVLAKHRVFYVPEVLDKDVTERETKSGTTLIYTALIVAYTFYAPDGSNIRAVVVGEAMDTGDKSSNKAMSAALKYALLQIFCVPTEANEDADAQSHEIKPKAGVQTPPPQPPKPSTYVRPRSVTDRAQAFVTARQVKAFGEGVERTWRVGPADQNFEVWKDSSGVRQCQCAELEYIRRTDSKAECVHIIAVAMFVKAEATAGVASPPRKATDLVG